MFHCSLSHLLLSVLKQSDLLLLVFRLKLLLNHFPLLPVESAGRRPVDLRLLQETADEFPLNDRTLGSILDQGDLKIDV